MPRLLRLPRAVRLPGGILLPGRRRAVLQVRAGRRLDGAVGVLLRSHLAAGLSP